MNKSQFLSVSVMAMILLTAAATLHAETEEAIEPLVLQGVMQQLGRDMQAVTGAIATENWSTVAELAPKIARHAQPPMMEKLRILSWLGSDAGKFRGFDGDVHDAAMAMREAAMRGKGQAVISAFSEVQLSCLGCHLNFREPFIKHFYGPR